MRSPTCRLVLPGLAILLASAAAAATKPPVRAPIAELDRALVDLAGKVAPAVVQIAATAYAPREAPSSETEGLLGRERRGGSGVLLSADGFILTNAHVVEGARRLRVLVATPASSESPRRSLLQPPGRWIEGRVVGADRETDLAVVKVDESGLPHLAFGDSDHLRPGQVVLAFGSPLGLENSVTMGVVSAAARQLEPESRMVYVQTDAPINPGNSGGPLVNLAGEVVGVNTLIFSRSGGSEGIGFAAPSNIARNVFQQIRAHGRVRRGEIGVNAQTVTPLLAKGLGLPRDWGVVLADVAPGGPAARAGLEPGDLVRELDGKVMENGRQLDVNLYRRAPGETVTLEVERDARVFPIEVVVTERAEEVPLFDRLVNPEQNLIPKLGVLALDLTPELTSRMPWLRAPSGVLVAARAANAPFTEEGLAPGDVVVAVNRERIPHLAALRQALSSLAAGSAVVLQVNRLGRQLYVAFEME